jgi:hypothetical protein
MQMAFGSITTLTTLFAATVACCAVGFMVEVRHGLRALRRSASAFQARIGRGEAEPRAFGRWT